jgi:hypothetical protein
MQSSDRFSFKAPQQKNFLKKALIGWVKEGKTWAR